MHTLVAQGVAAEAPLFLHRPHDGLKPIGWRQVFMYESEDVLVLVSHQELPQAPTANMIVPLPLPDTAAQQHSLPAPAPALAPVAAQVLHPASDSSRKRKRNAILDEDDNVLVVLKGCNPVTISVKIDVVSHRCSFVVIPSLTVRPQLFEGLVEFHIKMSANAAKEFSFADHHRLLQSHGIGLGYTLHLHAPAVQLFLTQDWGQPFPVENGEHFYLLALKSKHCYSEAVTNLL